MNQYYVLLKKEIIDFDKLLIEKYKSLDLDEVDTIILIKLNKVLKFENKFSIDLLTKGMSISEDELRNRLAILINNQFITLLLDKKNEIYSIDNTYKRLAEVILKDDEDNKNEDNENEIKRIVELLQKSFNKILTPLDMEIVHNWIYTNKFTYEEISEAVLETLKFKKKSIQYVDVILNKKEEDHKINTNDDLVDLFNQVYGKIK